MAEESNVPAGSEQTTPTSRDHKRSRRPGRGRRGRGPRRPPHRPEQSSELTAPADAPPSEQVVEAQSATLDEENTFKSIAPFTLKETAPPVSADSAIQKAIQEVNQVIESLRDTLDEMEGVLETLELAERQKDADEHEIEALRRTLRNLQRRDEPRRPG
jgi:hypothetical protein